MKTLSERLNYVLATKNIGQAELANAIGIKRQAINFLCSSSTNTSKYTPEIARVLDISEAWLLTGAGTPENVKFIEFPLLNNVEEIVAFLDGDLDTLWLPKAVSLNTDIVRPFAYKYENSILVMEAGKTTRKYELFLTLANNKIGLAKNASNKYEIVIPIVEKVISYEH